MRLHLRRPAQAINKAYVKQSIPQYRMDAFRQALTRLFSRVNEKESEDYQKTLVIDFLQGAFLSTVQDAELNQIPSFQFETNEQIDLQIHQMLVDKQLTSTVFEIRKVYAGDMMTPLKNNVRALHELILYYFDQREHQPDKPVNQLVITDIYNWFLFDEADFQRFFYNNPKLKKLYQLKQQNQKEAVYFYNETAKILRDLDDEVPVTYLNLREATEVLNHDLAESNRLLIPALKLLSPEHLLNLLPPGPPVLNQQFYNELLHIIGLRETIVNRQPVLQRLPEGERFQGSLLEITIGQLRSDNALTNLEPASQYESDTDDQFLGIGMSLCLTWLGRILFLKLLEGQLMRLQGGTAYTDDRSVRFLTTRQLSSFDELNDLFFEVLAVPHHQRSTRVTRFGAVPFLNSSLFESTELERKTHTIKKLDNQPALPLFKQTILRHSELEDNPLSELPTLRYLLEFLDAYQFAPETPSGLQIDSRPLIDTNAVGQLLDKLVSYGKRSHITPDFSITYLTRQAVHQIVVSRFNKRFGWTCSQITDLCGRLGEISLTDANAVINSLRIVDPAIRGGRFLVSALNELLLLKAELGLLTDREGRPLHQYRLHIVQNELIVTDENSELLDFSLAQDPNSSPQAQRPFPHVIEALFHEKQNLIENCLFGIDNNPDAVFYGRLRLYTELLKNLYYTKSGQFPTLPNLDLNIRAGNALVSRFSSDFQPTNIPSVSLREKFSAVFQRYRRDVLAYKRCSDKSEKERIRTRLRKFSEFIKQLAPTDQKEIAQIRQLEAKLAQATLALDFVNQQEQIQQLTDRLIARKKAYEEKQLVLNQAFEWRFTFPEVLDETGAYLGFDLVFGEPPRDQNSMGSAYRSYLTKSFPDTYTSASTLYSLFTEQGIRLLKQGGQVAYLLPNNWLKRKQSQKFRSWLISKGLEQLTVVNSGSGNAKTTLLLLNIHQESTVIQVRIAEIKPPDLGQSSSMDYQFHLVSEVPIDSLRESDWALFDELPLAEPTL
jgi:hypothetical protein